MNQRGKTYIEKIGGKYISYQPSPSEVSERIMRLGIEKRAYELDGYDDLYQVAVATIKEDHEK